MTPHRFRAISGPLSFLIALSSMAAVAAGPTPAADRAPGLVRAIKVLPEGAPDCSSLKAIVDSVTRGCRTNDEKAVAIYNFMRLTHYHFAYPTEPGGIPALKEINCYGWSLCGGLHATESALWRELGWDWRFVGWSDPGHTTVEAGYDGRWHYLDVFLKFYAWMPDPNDPSRRTIAGEDDLAADPKRLLEQAFEWDPARKVVYARANGHSGASPPPAFLVCGDRLEDVARGVRHRHRAGSPDNWGGIHHATGDYSAEVDLAPGFALTNAWDRLDGAWYWAADTRCPGHTCGDKEIRNSPEKGPVAEPYLGPGWSRESYASGTLRFAPDLSAPTGLQSFSNVENARLDGGRIVASKPGKPASVTVSLRTPYILTQATGSAEGVGRAEVSVDGGRTWKDVDIKDFGAAVKGRVSALVRLTVAGALRDLRLSATVQNNPFALPFLAPGRNTVAVSVANPSALGENRLVVTYAYRKGARTKDPESMRREGKEIARAHNAHWDEATTVVQRTFTARDLPARFEIDVPTARGRFPVYPRMIFLRREVLAPGQEPLPLPEGARSPTVGPDDTLMTLPSPLATGLRPARDRQPD